MRKQEGEHAVKIGGPGTKRDQREHVQMTVDHRHPAALEEGPAAPENNRRRENKLKPKQGAGADEAPQRIPGQGGRNHQQQRGYGEREAEAEAAGHTFQFGVGVPGTHLHGFEGHAAFWARPRTGAQNLRVHGAGVLNLARDGSYQDGFEGHAAFWAVSRPRLPDLRVHGTGKFLFHWCRPHLAALAISSCIAAMAFASLAPSP